MSLLLLLAAAASPLGRQAPAVPPADGVSARATVTIISAVAVAGFDLPAPSQLHHARRAELRLADGSTRPTFIFEFE